MSATEQECPLTQLHPQQCACWRHRGRTWRGIDAGATTEADLVHAGNQLRRAIATGDHPRRQDIADIADWLCGARGAPGSGWPLRAPLVELEFPGYERITGTDEETPRG